MRWKCQLNSIYMTARYGLFHALATGHMVLGHNFNYTGEVLQHYWVMECNRCHIRAAIDQGPKNPDWA